MDPDKTLEELMDAMWKGDKEEAIERLDALSDWLKNGGFMPTNVVPSEDGDTMILHKN